MGSEFRGSRVFWVQGFRGFGVLGFSGLGLGPLGSFFEEGGGLWAFGVLGFAFGLGIQEFGAVLREFGLLGLLD